MNIEVRKGIFKHILKSKQGRLVCLPLYADGWCITNRFGTVMADVRGKDADAEKMKIEMKEGNVFEVPDGTTLLDAAKIYCKSMM